MDIDTEATSYERELLNQQEEYTADQTNQKFANHLLSGVSRLDTTVSMIDTRYSSYVDSRHEFQDIFVVKGVRALESLYLSIKFRRYDSAYRDIRFLLETYLLVKHLNEHKIKASRIHSRHMAQIRDEIEDLTLLSEHRMESIDIFYDIIKTEKQNYKEFDDGLETYNFLSNRSSHPHRIVGARLDGEHAEYEEKQLFEWGLDLFLCLCIEYAKLYSDTPAFRNVKNILHPIVSSIEDFHVPQRFVELSLSGPMRPE